jgi:hypothetical protein
MKFIQAGKSYINVDKIIEVRVGMYQEGRDMKGIVDMFQVEAFMEFLGWTTIQDGFETEGLAALALLKLALKLQVE